MNDSPLKGTIIRRMIRGKERFYHQWREDGVTKSRYLKADEILPLRTKLEAAKRQSTLFLVGRRLEELCAAVNKLKKRSLFRQLCPPPSDLCVLTGDARSGKTVLLQQAIAALSEEDRARAAYLSCPVDFSASSFMDELSALFERGIRLFFLDALERSQEVTNLLPSLADTYLPLGCRFLVASRTPLSSLPAPHSSLLAPHFSLRTSPLSFADFSLLHHSDSLEDYLDFRGLPALLAAASAPSPHLGAAARKRAREKLRRECAEKLLKNLVLEETRLRRTSATVEVLTPTLPSGGVDMIVVDHEELTCELYEIRYALERNDKQLAHLEHSRNLDHLEHLYGMITAREVLYLGRNAWHHAGVFYRNLAAYLKGGRDV